MTKRSKNKELRVLSHRQKFRYQRGAALAETIIAVPALLMLGLGVLQSTLFYQAKTTVTYATFEAARKGAVTQAQKQPMLLEFGTRVAPLYGGDGSAAKANAAMQAGRTDVFDSRIMELDIINPTREAFLEYGVENAKTGSKEIPNTHLKHRDADAVGSRSKVNIHDANLLKIRAVYGFELKVPLVGSAVTAVMKRFDSANARFYDQGRVPIQAVSTVRMQSAAIEDGNLLADGSKPGGGTLPNGDTGGGDGGDDGGDGQDGGGQGGGSTPNEGEGGNQVVDGNPNTDDDGDSFFDNTDPDCQTEWSDDRYNQENIKKWGVSIPFTGTINSAIAVVEDFFRGIADGVVEQVTGLVDMGKQIIDMAKAILSDAGVILEMAKKLKEIGVKEFVGQIAEQLVTDARTVVECGPKDIGLIVGQYIGPSSVGKLLKAVSNVLDVDLLKKFPEYKDRDRDGDGDDDSDNGNNNDGNDIDEGAACSLTRASFPQGTLVKIPSGFELIEKLKAGQLIEARKSAGFVDSPQKIVQLHSRVAPDYYQLITELGEVSATREHPFWVQGAGWTPAEDIKVGDVVATRGGDAFVVSNNEVVREIRVYNLTIENTPNYFVTESEFWVHNVKPDCPDADFAARIGAAGRLLKETADEVREEWVNNPKAFTNTLSDAQKAAIKEKPWLAKAYFGTKLEIEVAKRIRNKHPDASIEWTNVGNAPYDFSITGPNGNRYTYDITTDHPTTIRNHVNRAEVDKVISYERLDNRFIGDVIENI